MNLLSNFKRCHLLHVGHGTAKKFASKAKGDPHVPILLQTMNDSNAISGDIFPSIFRRGNRGFNPNPISYLEIIYFFHVSGISLPWNWPVGNVDNQKAITLYVTYSSHTMMSLTTPSISRLCDRALNTDPVTNLERLNMLNLLWLTMPWIR
uniref:Uncharacterized protein n=1 Tax=Opuntia streptacantha TaxID=393608 RepID=A0A7C9A089_OPUST